MRRRQPEFNYWPGVADTMLIAFIMLLGLWFGQQSLTKIESMSGSGGIVRTGEDWKKLEAERDLLRGRNAALHEDNTKLKAELRAKDDELARAANHIRDLEKLVRELQGRIASLDGEVKKLNEQIMKLNNKPPVISLPETSGYKFQSGTAKFDPAFASLLEKEVFARIEEVLKRGDVNAIEIIGHTDGQAVLRREAGNLDAQLGAVLAGRQSAGGLAFGSNADLGLVRAVVVRREIEAWLKRKGLSEKIQVRCYSAANSVPFTGKLDDPKVFAGEEAARRRIEIRFTQLAPAISQETPAASKPPQ